MDTDSSIGGRVRLAPPVRRVAAILLTALTLGACTSGGSGSGSTAEGSSESSGPSVVVASDAIESASRLRARLLAAEALVDAFYAFDEEALAAILADLDDTGGLLYYQGFAEAAGYEVESREPCEAVTAFQADCRVTFASDLAAAIGVDEVTETFELLFNAAGTVVAVSAVTDDPPVVEEAFGWVLENRPDLLEGPCVGMFEDGANPRDCARAMVEAFEDFAESRGLDRGPGLAARTWTRLPDAPLARTEVAAASLGGSIVVAGGFTVDGVTAAVEVYDPDQRTWSAGPDLPVAVHHAMAAWDGERAYVLGGYLGSGFATPSDRAFSFDGDSWQELPAMPQGRAAGGAAVVGGRLYVAGGVGPRGLATSMLVLDLASLDWSSADGPPTPREHLAVAGHGDLLYVLGGRTGGIGSNLATAEVFDPDDGTWSTLPDMPTARGGIGGAATTSGLIVVPGGEQRSGTYAEVEAFDVEAGSWVVLPPLPTPRHGLGVVAIGTDVYVVSGGPEPGFAFSGANEVIDLSDR